MNKQTWTGLKAKCPTLCVPQRQSHSLMKKSLRARSAVPWSTCRWLLSYLMGSRLHSYPSLHETGTETFLLIYIRFCCQNKKEGSCLGEGPMWGATMMHSVGVGTAKGKTWIQCSYHNKQRIGDWKPRQENGKCFDFCPPFPSLSQNLIKVIHLGLCVLPDNVSGPYKR